MAEQGAREAMAEQGAREAMAEQELGRPWWDRLRDRGPSPHLSLFGRSPTTPPQNFLGEAQGIRSPPGLNTHKQLKRPWSLSGQIRHGRLACQYGSGRLGYHNRLAWQIMASSRRAWPHNGRGRRAGGSLSRLRAEWTADGGLAFPATLEAAADGGLAFPTDGGVISRERRGRWAADGGVNRGSELAFPANDDQRAWVSGNPASLSQRQSGELESAALLASWNQRQAGGHWVRGRPAGIESEAGRRARVSRGWRRHPPGTEGWMIRERRRELPRTAGWQSRERRRQLPRTAGSLSRERRQEVPRTAGWESRERRRKLPRTAGWESRERRRKLPRTAGMKSREPRDGRAANGGVNSREPRAWGLAASGLACREGQNSGTNKTLEKTNKSKRGEGTTLTVGLVFCYGAHSRERRGTRRRGRTSK